MWSSLLVSLPLLGTAGLFGVDCPRQATVEQLDREVLACQVRLEQAAEAAKNCGEGEGAMALYRELLQAFSGTEVQVVRDGPRVVVTIPSAMLFPADRVEVRREAQLVVDFLATALNLHTETMAWVIAHTDDSPLPRDLQRRHGDALGLSRAQAAAVVHALSSRFSVAPGRLLAAGQGSARPLVPAETDGARAKNRRVVVIIGPGESWR